MNPVPGHEMLAFLEWLTTTHPEIESVVNQPRERLLTLAAEFDAESGRKPLYHRVDLWERSLSLLLDTAVPADDYDRVRRFERFGALRVRQLARDPLRRLRDAPLHALFLYSSEDRALASYLVEQWSALDGMSAGLCDIHPNFEQLLGEDDAYTALRTLQMVVDAVDGVRLSALPVLLYWDGAGHAGQLSLRGWDGATIGDGLRTVFERVRIEPGFASLAEGAAAATALAEKRRSSRGGTTSAGGRGTLANTSGPPGPPGPPAGRKRARPRPLRAIAERLRDLTRLLPEDRWREVRRDVSLLIDTYADGQSRLDAAVRIETALLAAPADEGQAAEVDSVLTELGRRVLTLMSDWRYDDDWL
ncbi:hypothetical protein [Streptomyces sp. NBC_01190]|uniref:hypothetical protein n=1 Tax=Streptomyces sp. NBC_01190 TaxID=2903767 RepID=UPI00386802DF|nr:hypothetical protein OG519_27425 [Streptomyces sp. NBC_01190]